MKKEAREYWNPFLETLPAEKLAEIELKNFRRHLAYSKEHSLLCREKFRDVLPEDIRRREDLMRLPMIDKEDLRLAQLSEQFGGR